MPKRSGLPLSLAEEEARFNDMLDAMAGAAALPANRPLPPDPEQRARVLEAELMAIRASHKLLEQRVQALEAELVPAWRSRKCPCCHRLSLNVIATRPHPEFADHDIEQHDIRCDQCGHQGHRLYDPTGFIC